MEKTCPETRAPLQGRDKVAAATDAEVAAFGALTLGGVGVTGRPTRPRGSILKVQTVPNPMGPTLRPRADVGIGARTATGARTGGVVTGAVGGLDIEPKAAPYEAVRPVALHGLPVAGALRPPLAGRSTASGSVRLT